MTKHLHFLENFIFKYVQNLTFFNSIMLRADQKGLLLAWLNLKMWGFYILKKTRSFWALRSFGHSFLFLFSLLWALHPCSNIKINISLQNAFILEMLLPIQLTAIFWPNILSPTFHKCLSSIHNSHHFMFQAKYCEKY